MYCVYAINNNALVSAGQITLYTPSYDASVRELTVEADLTCPSNPIKPGATPLRYTAYSSTAAEVFWGRDENPNTRYNVFRDGVLVAKNTASTSYFQANLTPNSKYTFCVYDILDNTVTDREAVTVITLDNGSGAEPIPAAGTCPSDPLGAGRLAPRPPSQTVGRINLTGAVYSPTALEIFWNRSTVAGVTYNIFIDGELVQSNSAANSLYLTNLAPGTSYSYGVTAVVNGNTVSSSGLTLTTNPF